MSLPVGDHKTVLPHADESVVDGVQETTLASREAVIERGLETFIEVGSALLAIREDRQYVEAGFANFEGYCRGRWQMSDSRARQLIAASQTVTKVTVTGLPAPTSERVTRELVSAPEPAEVWEKVVERHGPTPTAAQVREVVQGEAPTDDPAAAWFKAGEKAQRDRVSEMYRLHEGAKPCRKVDWEALASQVVVMSKLERQMLSGSADTFERSAQQIRQLLETKLEVVK